MMKHSEIDNLNFLPAYSLVMWFIRSLKNFVKVSILKKFFDDLMSHITREYAGKKIKLFLNVSPLTIVNLLL